VQIEVTIELLPDTGDVSIVTDIAKLRDQGYCPECEEYVDYNVYDV